FTALRKFGYFDCPYVVEERKPYLECDSAKSNLSGLPPNQEIQHRRPLVRRNASKEKWNLVVVASECTPESSFATMEQIPHIVIVISPAMGHIIPLVEFAKRLILHDDFSLTFLIPTYGPLQTL
ncbi:hypothetical protein RJ639_013572, partial [Escallonia herrerae]